MRSLPRRALLAAPVAVLAFALTACGGSDSGSDNSSAADTQQQSQSTADAQAAGEAPGDDKPEPPLTGDIKSKAEAAALAAYPGTVIKSEEDAEKPGMYAVEVKQADGTSIEVYLDKTYKVTDTKKEGTEEADDAS